MDKSKVFGLVVVGIIAYLWYRGKRGSAVSENDPLKEVELRNLQIKENQLQSIIEDKPNEALGKLQSLSQQIENIASTQVSNSYNRFSDYPNWARANELNYQFMNQRNQELGELKNQLKIAESEYDSALADKNVELERESFYNQLSLADIRQKLNPSEGGI